MAQKKESACRIHSITVTREPAPPPPDESIQEENHPILRLTRALLYEYWRKHDKMVDYFLLHDFLELAIETYPKEWNKVVPSSNAAPHILLLRLFEPCDEQVLEAAKAATPFHKLTYKFEEGKEELPGTYYQALRGMLRK